MLGIHDFGVFLATGIVLNLTPGPDTFYILGRSVAQGRSAGIASALGISTGSLVHTFAAALGLSALLAASASAFLAVKLAGAAYLVYLGCRMLFSRASAATIPQGFSSSGFRAVYRQGLLTNVLNPKVALFFLAFMPQFIAADSPSKFAAFVTLGLCFTATGTLWCLCLAWFSSLIGDRLRGSTTFAEVLNRTAGALFVFLGVRLATTK
jgi:threonine/homoserine/homoserine lactone efflux protein